MIKLHLRIKLILERKSTCKVAFSVIRKAVLMQKNRPPLKSHS